MRAVTVPYVPFHGALLTTELIAAGVPMRTPPVVELGSDVYREGETLVVVVSTAHDNALHDSTVAAVVAAHVKPEDATPKQLLRERIVERWNALDSDIAVLVQAAVLELHEIDTTIGQAYMSLRQRVMTGSGTPIVLSAITPVQLRERIINRIANILTD